MRRRRTFPNLLEQGRDISIAPRRQSSLSDGEFSGDEDGEDEVVCGSTNHLLDSKLPGLTRRSSFRNFLQRLTSIATPKRRTDGMPSLSGAGSGSLSDVDEDRSHWQPDTASNCCGVCTVGFTLMRRRHHCRDCGILICASCSKYKSLPGQRDPCRHARVANASARRVCTKCFDANFRTTNVQHKPAASAALMNTSSSNSENHYGVSMSVFNVIQCTHIFTQNIDSFRHMLDYLDYYGLDNVDQVCRAWRAVDKVNQWQHLYLLRCGSAQHHKTPLANSQPGQQQWRTMFLRALHQEQQQQQQQLYIALQAVPSCGGSGTQDVQQLSIEDVLRQLDISVTHTCRFEAEAVRVDTLALLTESDLRRMNIPMGPRRKLLHSTDELPGPPALRGLDSVTTVPDFLSVVGLSHLIPIFQDEEFDLDSLLLLQMGDIDADLLELGLNLGERILVRHAVHLYADAGELAISEYVTKALQKAEFLAGQQIPELSYSPKSPIRAASSPHMRVPQSASLHLPPQTFGAHTRSTSSSNSSNGSCTGGIPSSDGKSLSPHHRRRHSASSASALSLECGTPSRNRAISSLLRDASRATARIVVVNQQGKVCEAGSGAVVDKRGLVSTCLHILRNPKRGYDATDPTSNCRILIGINTATHRPPEWRFCARCVAYDPIADLAILRVISAVRTEPAQGLYIGDLTRRKMVGKFVIHDSGALPNPTHAFPSIPLACSVDVEAGDEAYLLSYPLGGHNTLSTQHAHISGFDSQVVRGQRLPRAWLRTVASVDNGASGGAALILQRGGGLALAGIISFSIRTEDRLRSSDLLLPLLREVQKRMR